MKYLRQYVKFETTELRTSFANVEMKPSEIKLI